MGAITVEAEDIIYLILILFLSFIGSLSKDYVVMFNGKGQMNVKRIIFSTFTASIITFIFSPLIVESFGVRGIIAGAYLAGLVGFELLQRMSTTEGILDLLEKASMIFNIFKFTVIFWKSEQGKKGSSAMQTTTNRSEEIQQKVMEESIKSDEEDRFVQFLHAEKEKEHKKEKEVENLGKK
jgi:hypothetical protein